MPFNQGSTQYFAFKEETVNGTEESGAGGTTLRRVTGQLELTKAEVTSNEKRTDFQEVTVNHGTRGVNFALNSELYGGDYEPFIAAVMRRDFTAVSQITGDFSISSGVLTRAAGSFISDGLTNGMIVRLGTMGTTANLNRNLRVSSVTATTCALHAVDGGAAVADDAGPNASATMDIPGEYNYIPDSAHTTKSFTVEKYDSGLDQSQIARGVKIGSMEIGVQPDQIPTVNFGGLGIDRRNVDTAEAPVLTSPGAAGTGAAMSSAIGFVRVNGTSVACITGLSLNVDLGVNSQPVAFSNVSCDIFYGRAATVSGSITVLKQDQSLSDLFDAETEVELEFYLEAPGSDPQSFVSLFLPRVKLMGDSEDDPDGPVQMTLPFRALKKATATGYDPTVLMIQDSQNS